MSDKHIIAEDLLLDYAAGAVAEPVAVLVATHLALNPEARRRYRCFEALGGALIEEIEPEPLTAGALETLWDRLALPTAAPQQGAAAPAAEATPLIPRPLRDYVGEDLATLPWKPLMRGVVSADLSVGGREGEGFFARMVKIEAGRAVPRHSHQGNELVLVLDGGFTDHNGHFVRGDVSIGDQSLDHRPVADPGIDCLCLIVSDAPVRLTGPLGWLLSPFVRF